MYKFGEKLKKQKVNDRVSTYKTDEKAIHKQRFCKQTWRETGNRNGFKSIDENKEDSEQMQGHSFFLGDGTNSRNNVVFFNLQTNKRI